MLDDFATTVENLGPCFEALGHAVERGLVFEAGNRAHVVRASRAHWAVTTRASITIIDFGEIAQPAVADRRQQRPGRANIGVAPDIVAKLVLAEEAHAEEEPRCGLGTCGMQPAFSQASMSSILK